MNREEADQDVVDELSEEVDSRAKVMRSEKNDWYCLPSISVKSRQLNQLSELIHVVRLFCTLVL